MQPPGHLLRRDVHGVNADRAVLQQAIREASGGRAHIETYLSRRVDQEILERTFELKSSPAGVTRLRGYHFDPCTHGNTFARLVVPLPLHTHFARQKHGLSFLARFGEPPVDEQHVNSLLGGLLFLGFA